MKKGYYNVNPKIICKKKKQTMLSKFEVVLKKYGYNAYPIKNYEKNYHC